MAALSARYKAKHRPVAIRTMLDTQTRHATEAGQGRGCIAEQFRNKLNNFSISQTDRQTNDIYAYEYNVLVVVTAVAVVVIEFQIEFN